MLPSRKNRRAAARGTRRRRARRRRALGDGAQVRALGADERFQLLVREVAAEEARGDGVADEGDDGSPRRGDVGVSASSVFGLGGGLCRQSLRVGNALEMFGYIKDYHLGNGNQPIKILVAIPAYVFDQIPKSIAAALAETEEEEEEPKETPVELKGEVELDALTFKSDMTHPVKKNVVNGVSITPQNHFETILYIMQ